MRKFTKAVTIVCTLAMLFTQASYATDLDSAKSKLSDLQRQQQEEAGREQSLRATKADIESYITEVDKKLTDLATDIYNVENDIELTNDDLDLAGKTLKNAEESEKNQYADMKLRIQYLYEEGDVKLLDLILNSASLSEFLNKAEYISDLSQYDRDMLKKLKETRKTIADTKKQLEDDKKELEDLDKKLKESKEKLEKVASDKKAELEKYTAMISDSQSSQKALSDQITAQEQYVAEAEQESIKAEEDRIASEEGGNHNEDYEAAEKNRESKGSGKKSGGGGSSGGGSGGGSDVPSGGGSGQLSWPLPGYTTISSGYGYREDPFSGARTFHNGIDVPAPSGTPIHAAAAGTVDWSNLNPTAGNWIAIYHGNGIRTVYMHMSLRLVQDGEKVKKGQVIGLVGTTGSSTGNHLHFSVTSNGSYVNPWSYL